MGWFCNEYMSCRVIASEKSFEESSGGRIQLPVFKRKIMLETIAIILVILWLLGLGFHIAGGLIHILLVIAAVVILIRIIRGQKPL